MPMIEVPDYDRLPPSLYGDAFRKLNHDVYLFHDKTWFANSPHMLGWSREIEWIREHDMALPPTLVGDAFRLHDAKASIYRLDQSPDLVSFHQLVLFAQEAQKGLEKADVHLDQWGFRSLPEWHQYH